MKRILRGTMFIVAIVMYIGLVYESGDMLTAVLRIVSVALLLMGMESVRRKGEKLYHQKSNIEHIDQMNENTFKEYIAQLYKKLDYYIQPNTNKAKVHYDFLIRKDKKVSIIKCIHTTDTINLDTLKSILALLESSKIKNKLLVTNQRFEEESLEYLKAQGVEYIERRDLIKQIEETVQKESFLGQRTKVQET